MFNQENGCFVNHITSCKETKSTKCGVAFYPPIFQTSMIITRNNLIFKNKNKRKEFHTTFPCRHDEVTK